MFIHNSEGIFPVMSEPKMLKVNFDKYFTEGADDDEIERLLEDLSYSVEDSVTLERIFQPIFGAMYTINRGTKDQPIDVS